VSLAPIDVADQARAERVLWRAERLSREEAEWLADAYPPPPGDPPAVVEANARAWSTLTSLGFESDLNGRSEPCI
jgi:hypothetical protein